MRGSVVTSHNKYESYSEAMQGDEERCKGDEELQIGMRIVVSRRGEARTITHIYMSTILQRPKHYQTVTPYRDLHLQG